MKTCFRLVVLMLLVGGWTLAAASIYVIQTPETIAFIPRNKISFTPSALSLAYTDTREWTMADVPDHPAIIRRMIELGRADLLQQLADPNNQMTIDAQLADAIHFRPRTAANKEPPPASLHAQPQRMKKRTEARIH